MLNKLKKINSGGFTIIEVMIVLAIAGLILLIVFLAVPALQRNARNTQRKQDISALVSAINEYVNNNNGALPSAINNFSVNWKPSYYTVASIQPLVNLPPTAPQTAGASDPGSVDKIIVTGYSTCNGSIATNAGATSRSVTITYDVETGNGGSAGTEQCVTAQ
jgi:prepilin-type N-terminal cleavage/methylation domain-containing protein